MDNKRLAENLLNNLKNLGAKFENEKLALILIEETIRVIKENTNQN